MFTTRNVIRRIFRVAFGTLVGAPDPESFWADREYVSMRWHADPGGALVAEANGTLAGSNFATNWGSFGFFGPLTVRPELWDQHIAQRMLVPTMSTRRSERRRRRASSAGCDYRFGKERSGRQRPEA